LLAAVVLSLPVTFAPLAPPAGVAYRNPRTSPLWQCAMRHARCAGRLNPLPEATGVANRAIPRAQCFCMAQGSSPNRVAHPHPAEHGA